MAINYSEGDMPPLPFVPWYNPRLPVAEPSVDRPNKVVAYALSLRDRLLQRSPRLKGMYIGVIRHSHRGEEGWIEILGRVDETYRGFKKSVRTRAGDFVAIADERNVAYAVVELREDGRVHSGIVLNALAGVETSVLMQL